MDDLEQLLLGAPVTLTAQDVMARAGVQEELADAVWAALGFPHIPDDVVAFTERDVDALKDSLQLLSSGLVDVDTWLVLARTMGQALSRLAEAQLDVFRAVAPGLPAHEGAALAVQLGPEVVPRIERTLLYVWRRQFAAAAQRALATGRDEEGLTTLAVGFVDIVDYTRTVRGWDAQRLTRALEAFERAVSLRVAAVGGRVVKTLGDGVLYVTRTARDAVDVALDTLAAHEADDTLPAVRAGVALGPVLERLGDVYGSPVNLASRLCDQARPLSLLVDRRAAAELAAERTGEGTDGPDAAPGPGAAPGREGALGREGRPALSIRPLERRAVRGFRALSPFLVRREP